MAKELETFGGDIRLFSEFLNVIISIYEKQKPPTCGGFLAEQVFLLAVEGCMVNDDTNPSVVLPGHALHTKSFLQEMERNQYRREADHEHDCQNSEDR